MQIFLQRRHTDDQQIFAKMLNITNHKANANQNHNEISSHICQNSYYQKQTNKNNKHWQRCRENGTLVHCWQESKLVQPLWKTIRRFLKKLKIELLSVQFSCSVVSNSLQPHKSHHARSSCPSQTPRVYSNSCPSS